MGSIGLKYVSANERCEPLLGRFYDYQKSWMYFLNVKAHLKSQRTVHGVNEEEKSALGIEHKKPQHSNTVDRTIHWGKIHPIISGLTKAEGLFGCLTWQQSHQCSPNKPQLALQVCFARVENNPFLEYCCLSWLHIKMFLPYWQISLTAQRVGVRATWHCGILV